MPIGERSLILSDGGLASLIACAAAGQSQPRSPAAVLPMLWEHAEPASRLAAAARHAELSGLTLADLPVGKPVAPDMQPGALQTHVLVLAASSAAAAGFSRVIWPVHAGPGAEPDLDRVARAIDRALLVSRLVALDADEHGSPAIRVDTPYADFTDRQIAELAIDLDAPIHSCWWWGGQDGTAAAERQRWTAHLQSFGWLPA